MNNDSAREIYKKSGIRYSNIGENEIKQLITYINIELKNSDSDIKMKLSKPRINDINYDSNNKIKNCYLMVDSNYFKRREAISFNTQDINGNEFIGFAGWAGTKNVEPFIIAFTNWIKNMSH